MGKRIFVSYKYADSGVAPLLLAAVLGETTQARHYVTLLESKLKEGDHIYKGEKDNEPLDGFKNETIESKLRNKIFDSSVTIVLISKNMKDSSDERDQWIPWEVAYSLKEITKNGVTSKTNAILLVALPDENGSYSYIVNTLPCGVTSWDTPSLFYILRKNMFNRHDTNSSQCLSCSSPHHNGNDHSYAYPVRWDLFYDNIDDHIDHVVKLKENIADYKLTKVVKAIN